MRVVDEWEITFKTRDRLFEWMVMPFDLYNSPITFTRMMNDMFKSFIGRFIIVYFDDILTYNKDKEEHLSHLQVVFQTLRS
jgi:hypothetical protein